MNPQHLDLEATLLQFVETLYKVEPNHPIFGEPIKGSIKLPYEAPRKNGQCWRNVMTKIAKWVTDEMGDKWALDSCWMSNRAQVQITKTSGPHSNDVYASITVTRLLAFFASPTPQNWRFLSEQDNAENTPFDHRCARGHTRYDGKQIGCLNGVFHGKFRTRRENEGRKACRHGAVCLCPGHDEGGKCIYTRGDGTLAPCRNVEDHVPIYKCEKPCY